jgi:hypothetical protein
VAIITLNMASSPGSDDHSQSAAIRAAAGDLSVLYHLFYMNSPGLHGPAGREMMVRLAAIHPRVAEAVERFNEGMNSDAANSMLDLLDDSGVDIDVVIGAEGRANEVDKRLRGSTSWYARAKGDQKEVEEKVETEPPCLDNTKPSHKHEVWLGEGPAGEDFPPARRWLLEPSYNGKSPAWWLSRCITGLPFTIEPFQAISGYLAIKPAKADLAIRLIVVRRGGKVIVVWWGLKTEYNRITSGRNLVRTFTSFSLKPTERLV